MNDPKIDYQNGLISDFSFEFGSTTRSSQNFSNMKIWVTQSPTTTTMVDDSKSHHQHHQNGVVPVKPFSSSSSPSATTIISRFESPASAFYATERCMGLPQYDSQMGFSSLGSQLIFSAHSCNENYDDSAHEQQQRQQNQPIFELGTSLPSMAKSQLLNSNSNILGSNGPFGLQPNLHVEDGYIPLKNLPGYCSSYNSPLTHMSFGSQQEKQSQIYSNGNNGCVSPVNIVSSNGHVISSKTRIRWGQDLHEKFVECVHRLGGADKATPKAILKLMDSDGLTIFHVKSHLQKYRIAKYLPDSAEGKSEKRTSTNVTPHFDATTGSQIKEALQLQLDVQRRLHEQLEIQRRLQLQIEEQGRQLKMMFDMQQRTGNSFFKSQSSDITSSDEAPSNSMDEVQLSIAEAVRNIL